MKAMKDESLEEVIKGILFDMGILKPTFDEHRDGLVLKYEEVRSIEEEDIVEISNRLKIEHDTNVKESELGNEDNEYVKQVKEYAKQEDARVVSLCAKVEEELSELSPEDKQEMLEGLGLDGSGLDKLITATYDILGLATYFTVGKDEVRAWTFKKGMNAKQCAGQYLSKSSA